MADVEAGQAPVQPAAPQRQPVSQWETKKMIRTLRSANMLNGILLMLTGVLVFILGFLSLNFTTFVIAAYVEFFGLLLTCLECNFSNLAPKFRRNFGFMFTFLGRTLFIIFCGTMLFAMNTWLGYLVGAITFVNGLFNGYVICIHPAFKKGGEFSARADPYGGYTGGEAEMLSFLKTNPAIANKAAAATLTFAASNPDAAAGIMRGAAAPQTAGQAGWR